MEKGIPPLTPQCTRPAVNWGTAPICCRSPCRTWSIEWEWSWWWKRFQKIDPKRLQTFGLLWFSTVRELPGMCVALANDVTTVVLCAARGEQMVASSFFLSDWLTDWSCFVCSRSFPSAISKRTSFWWKPFFDLTSQDDPVFTAQSVGLLRAARSAALYAAGDEAAAREEDERLLWRWPVLASLWGKLGAGFYICLINEFMMFHFILF